MRVTKINKRSLVSLFIGLCAAIIIASGFVMYFTPFNVSVAALHTSFGFLFVIGIFFHVVHNIRALKMYATSRKSKFPVSRILSTLFIGCSVVSYLVFMGHLGFDSIYDWGNEFRSQQLGKKIQSKNIELIELSKPYGDYSFELQGKLGSSFQYPMFAFWAEDTSGNYLKTLYVSESIGTSTFDYKKGKKGKHIIRRPSGLPVWAHRRNIKATDGLMIPLGLEYDLDGYTGATPLSDFIIKSKTDVIGNTPINLFFEVNQSYDWNDYYSKTRFPEDSIYTYLGQSGQPSVVYYAQINMNNFQKQNVLLKPIGHGHHSGKNGELYLDFSKIDSALDIVQFIVATITKNQN